MRRRYGGGQGRCREDEEEEGEPEGDGQREEEKEKTNGKGKEEEEDALFDIYYLRLVTYIMYQINWKLSRLFNGILHTFT